MCGLTSPLTAGPLPPIPPLPPAPPRGVCSFPLVLTIPLGQGPFPPKPPAPAPAPAPACGASSPQTAAGGGNAPVEPNPLCAPKYPQTNAGAPKVCNVPVFDMSGLLPPACVPNPPLALTAGPRQPPRPGGGTGKSPGTVPTTIIFGLSVIVKQLGEKCPKIPDKPAPGGSPGGTGNGPSGSCASGWRNSVPFLTLIDKGKELKKECEKQRLSILDIDVSLIDLPGPLCVGRGLLGKDVTIPAPGGVPFGPIGQCATGRLPLFGGKATIGNVNNCRQDDNRWIRMVSGAVIGWEF